MPINAKLAKSSFSRVFVQEGAPSPNLEPQYYGLSRAGALTWAQGDISPVRIPSDSRYDDFVTIDTIKGAQGLPSLPIEFRKELAASRVLELVQRGCDIGLQIHLGQCKDPRDSNAGWSDGHVIVIPGAGITNFSTSELGALDSDQRAILMETIEVTGQRIYQIKPLKPSLKAGTLITDEVIDVAICDSVTCGSCGLPSDGAQVMFALVADSSGSPGLPAKVVYTSDGGATWASSPITSLGLAEAPDAMACMGAYLVVVSNDSQSHHYILIADLLEGLGGWTEVTGGYNASGKPNDIHVVHANLAFVVGDGGYIYKLTDPTAAVTESSSGDVTTQILNAVSGVGEDFIIAVGASNAVIATFNGGATWATITGPVAAVALNGIAAQTDQLYLVVTGGGELWYTLDGGTNWTEKAIPRTGTGSCADIVFVTREVGYIAHTVSNVGYVYRTIDGGYSWYELPEGTLTMPTMRAANALAVPSDPGVENVLLIGGLAADANDGVLILAS